MVRAKFQHPAMPELRMATEYSSPAAFPQIRVPDRSPEPFPDFFKQSLVSPDAGTEELQRTIN